MEEVNKNSNGSKKIFLGENLSESTAEHHQSKLGMKVPAGYFEKSKSAILAAVKEEPASLTVVHKRKMSAFLKIAASVAIIIGVGTFFLYQESLFNAGSKTVAYEDQVDDLIYNSLLVEDDQLDDYVDGYLADAILADIEYMDGQPGEVTVNALFLEDDQLNDYVDGYLLDAIVTDIEKESIDVEEDFINSLLVEDEELDDYIDDYMIENIII